MEKIVKAETVTSLYNFLGVCGPVPWYKLRDGKHHAPGTISPLMVFFEEVHKSPDKSKKRVQTSPAATCCVLGRLGNYTELVLNALDATMRAERGRRAHAGAGRLGAQPRRADGAGARSFVSIVRGARACAKAASSTPRSGRPSRPCEIAWPAGDRRQSRQSTCKNFLCGTRASMRQQTHRIPGSSGTIPSYVVSLLPPWSPRQP